MINAKEVQKFREMTGVGMMDAKKALEEADGDMDKAGEFLRKSGAVKALKKSARSVEQGVVESYIHAGNKVGVLLKLLCETDFVARNEQFRQLAHDIALHIAGMKPLYVSADEIPEEVKESEMRIYKGQVEGSGKPADIVNKIIEGKMQAYASDVSLLDQPYVKDQDKKVKDVIEEHIAKLGENIKVAGFTRYEI